MCKYTKEEIQLILKSDNDYCLKCRIVIFGIKCPLCKSFNTTLKLKKNNWYNNH